MLRSQARAAFLLSFRRLPTRQYPRSQLQRLLLLFLDSPRPGWFLLSIDQCGASLMPRMHWHLGATKDLGQSCVVFRKPFANLLTAWAVPVAARCFLGVPRSQGSGHPGLSWPCCPLAAEGWPAEGLCLGWVDPLSCCLSPAWPAGLNRSICRRWELSFLCFQPAFSPQLRSRFSIRPSRQEPHGGAGCPDWFS